MAPKQICVCEDETFHPQLCLVAIEPVSNFILVERYAKHRDAKTWSEVLEEGLCGLPVTPNQLTGDGAKGLIRHAQTALNVHYGPDLFHGQQEISRGTAIASEAKITQTETAHDEASLTDPRSIDALHLAERQCAAQDDVSDVSTPATPPLPQVGSP